MTEPCQITYQYEDNATLTMGILRQVGVAEHCKYEHLSFQCVSQGKSGLKVRSKV